MLEEYLQKLFIIRRRERNGKWNLLFKFQVCHMTQDLHVVFVLIFCLIQQIGDMNNLDLKSNLTVQKLFMFHFPFRSGFLLILSFKLKLQITVKIKKILVLILSSSFLPQIPDSIRYASEIPNQCSIQDEAKKESSSS